MGFVAQAEVTRETFWTISPVGEALFYGLAAIASLVFLYGVYERVVRYAHGESDPFDRLSDLPGRIIRATKVVFSNEKQFDRDLYAGVMHTFIMWGFLTLLIGTTILAIDMDIWQRVTGSSFFVGDFYLSYSFVMDLMGLLFVVGIGMALWRRYGVRHPRLWGKHTSFEDDAFIWTLFLLGVGGYVIEAIRIVGTEFPDFETVSFVGYFIAIVFDAAGMSQGLAQTLYWFGWWSHAILALAFVAAVPYAKPLHMLTSFANVVTADEKAGLRLPKVPADTPPDEIGYVSEDDFSWKALLDYDACTKCGRCADACPAKASGRNLDPRDVILDLKTYRDSLDAGGESVDIVADGGTSVIAAESMESCMACMACMDSCPVDIEHLTHFTEMNRRLTETGQQQESVQEAMMNIFSNGNAFGDPQRKRPDWTDDLDFEVPDARDEAVEFLWYVGDYPSYDERNRRVARAMARIFEEAGVSYGILYEDEQNDGNDVRRVGEEGLYEMLVEDNISAMDDCDFEKIVCTDPHSYNTFKNEYPEMDESFDYPVFHYTQLVETLVNDDRLGLSGTELSAQTVTYHDPCHLGRYNGEYEAPREVIRTTGVELAEMPRNRADSFCCGGGGGGLWLDHEEESKPSEERLREALQDTEAGSTVERFVVACPMCATMYEDGRKTGGYEDDLDVVDISELIVEALDEKAGVTSTSETPASAD
ncbi:4Fe-4S dicluster domain-containing protein [Haloferax mediterranei ATCC 33500]|uniref:4Fe-4S dicluster domain-containing protein n=1 Tax=Haloferax mediterranei (strain ATCC 33500 / DSM 1411 / JCM 8866 / NBRC 14739 / NCIMB 2177 / R-4) TaxID=523841 RepID=I3R150_HALMT|nr:(Fe-S)-binding protein [Haloferax mediterranei]AFK17960.2 iron-sulfur protein (4Fe-4S) [Haloferax mediterranei ATCC 33500]AHZ22618.1 Fe-S oxidoreductase [Haloferax mediterranei ATCC 33500]EMA02762.1 iron-sulfur protein (4Fe-4S) [Haloferax mediterranei ATCC 33500]MDX5988053.1 (Fe-S)-binding protein [Haloferax mediterranei ATCC 33500]QCQ74512.1 4Fe-4S dicluster domain-containing protein [Haloferax mediterranei ATCC 33500]